jgi:hypothetical protein
MGHDLRVPRTVAFAALDNANVGASACRESLSLLVGEMPGRAEGVAQGTKRTADTAEAELFRLSGCFEAWFAVLTMRINMRACFLIDAFFR